MGRVALLLFLAAGCSFGSPQSKPDGNVPGDGSDGPSCTPWMTRGGHIKDVCTTPTSGTRWEVSDVGGTYDTTDGSFAGGTAPPSMLVGMGSEI